MPADPSSLVPAALAQLAHAEPLQDADPPHLLACLATVSNPRAARGRRHPLVAILGLAAAAMLAGARSIAAIAEWAADAPQEVRAALGTRRDGPDHCSVPAEATIRRTLMRLDADVLASAIGAWLADRDRHRSPRGRRAVAVDGKTLRGARPPGGDGRPVHLLACMDHASRAVLAQRQVGGAPEEVPAFAPLLAGLDLAGTVVTVDALQTHPEAAEFLVTVKRAHYLFTVKANQPTLLARCAGLPWHRVPVADRTRDRGHGRLEVRTLKAVTVGHFGFPHVAQVIQVTRRTCDLHASTRPWQTVTVYAITGLPFELARPARLADLLRAHWAIEALHHIRDVTFCEEASQVRTTRHGGLAQPHDRGAQPGGAGQPGCRLRRHARDPRRPLATLGISLG
ncbi:MAG TPA: ISAs1 family transposase [Actinomycetota bacterium]|nr:ISAs1 family transposase [Actinomycetota bacterium]